MTSPRTVGRLAAVVLPALLLVAGCGGEPPEAAGTGAAAAGVSTQPPQVVAPTAVATPAPPAIRTIAVTFAGGKVSGETGRIPVARGDVVELVVTSDVADEAHLHGYDRTLQVPAGGTGTLRLTADVPGVFEFELHHSGAELLSLRVA